MKRIYPFLVICILLSMLFIMYCKENNDGDGEAPSVVSTIPSNGSTGISILTTISLTFSIAMDIASVESAFSMNPSVSGTFSWSGNTMTYIPSAALNYNTTYTVTLASSARSSGGVTLSSDYTFSFMTQSTGGRVRNFTDTQNGIFIFSDQLPNSMTDAKWQFAAQHYVGCQKMLLSDVRRLRSYNANFIALHYRLALGAGTQEIITGDSWVSYWNDVNSHENWFVHMTRGNSASGRVHNGEWNWYYMDPSGSIEGAGSNGWKEYFVNATINEMRATECDGLFGDSCGLPFSLAQWPDWLDGTNPLTTWNPHVNTFMQYVASRYSQESERFYFIPNAGAMVTSWDMVTNYALADGAMVEGFSEWGAPPLMGELGDWILQMNNILNLTTQNKIVIMQTYPSSSDIRARMFALGCYLLIKGRYSYLNLMADGEMEVFWFPEYDIVLGAYTNDPPSNIDSLRTAEGAYKRNYANGWVYVNPTDSDIIINLGGTYRRVIPSGGGVVPDNGVPTGNLDYSYISSLTLSAAEAAIILK